MSVIHSNAVRGLLPSDPLYETFEQIAATIWKDLEKARRLGINRGEETVTNDFLLFVQERHENDVITFQFNKHEESITGADWEWWLTNGHHWLGLLIQAKILNPRTDRYSAIKHKVKGTPQIDLLISLARQRSIHPLYFFYNHTKLSFPDIQWRCQSMSPEIEQLGCTVAHASAVKNRVNQGGAGVVALSEIFVPLRCLVCRRGYPGPVGSLPDRANALVNSLPKGDGPPLDVSALRASPPGYVSELLSSRPENINELIEKLRPSVGPVGSIVIIKDNS